MAGGVLQAGAWAQAAALYMLTPQVDHLKQPENWAVVEAARVIYSAGGALV